MDPTSGQVASNTFNAPTTQDAALDLELRMRDIVVRERELAVKEREAANREAELEMKRKELDVSAFRNPLVLAILAAAVAAAGNAVVSLTNGTFERELEAQRAEQTRILEMIKTGDQGKAIENLRFLVSAGLIVDSSLKSSLSAYLDQVRPGAGPRLPPSTAASGTPDQPVLTPETAERDLAAALKGVVLGMVETRELLAADSAAPSGYASAISEYNDAITRFFAIRDKYDGVLARYWQPEVVQAYSELRRGIEGVHEEFLRSNSVMSEIRSTGKAPRELRARMVLLDGQVSGIETKLDQFTLMLRSKRLFN